MKKNIAVLLIILALAMVYIGGFYASKVMLPPIITGIGFFAIAAVFIKENNDSI